MLLLNFPYYWQLTEYLNFLSSIINFLFFKVELTACDQFYVVFGLAVMFFNSWQVQKWAKYLNSLCWMLRLQIGAWRFWGNRFEKLLSRKKNYVTSNYHRMGDLNFLKKKLIYFRIEKKLDNNSLKLILIFKIKLPQSFSKLKLWF